MNTKGRMATWVEYISSPSNAHVHFNVESAAMETMAYVHNENVFRAPYDILNFENAFSVIQIASTAETSRTATFFTLDAETETMRKSGPNVPKVWKPMTCLKNASTSADTVSESTNPTNEMGNPA